MNIKIKKLHPDAKIPTYAHQGDAGMDVFALTDVVIPSGERVKISTGVAFELPLGYVALVWDKSSLGTNMGLKNLGGVIDAGYRGEVFITLVNLSDKEVSIEKGHKIAQILIQQVEHPEIEEVNELSDSTRGAGGFGSTGK